MVNLIMTAERKGESLETLNLRADIHFTQKQNEKMKKRKILLSLMHIYINKYYIEIDL